MHLWLLIVLVVVVVVVVVDDFIPLNDPFRIHCG